MIRIALVGLLVFGVTANSFGQAGKDGGKRYVAIFYVAQYGDSFYKVFNQTTGDAWIVNPQNSAYGPVNVYQFWGKPAWAAQNGDGTIRNNYRYYFNGDPNQPNAALLDGHASLLCDAGVDFIVLDFTNMVKDSTNWANGSGPSYLSATQALCNRWQQRLLAGQPVPRIVFWVGYPDFVPQLENLFFNVYHKDLFFEYLGKRLLLTATLTNTRNDQQTDGQTAVPTDRVFANYTARHCWGLGTNLGHRWEFKVSSDTPPPPYYFQGEPEQACAPVATQGSASSNLTVDGINPAQGARGRDNGAYFIKYMDAAKTNGVKIVLIHSWNEWANPRQQIAGVGDCVFEDQWSQEYSSDIEPMAGGHGDTYYKIMKQKIAEFKTGVTASQVPFYRLLNSRNGDHFMTISAQERDNAISQFGYKLESATCRVWDAYAQGMRPFYRLTRARDGHRLYTTNEKERDNAIANFGFRYDRIACHVWDHQISGAVPLYRLSNSNGDYLYTTSAAERDNAIAQFGYHLDQIACYVGS